MLCEKKRIQEAESFINSMSLLNKVIALLGYFEGMTVHEIAYIIQLDTTTVTHQLALIEYYFKNELKIQRDEEVVQYLLYTAFEELYVRSLLNDESNHRIYNNILKESKPRYS